jgi:hypothetical protein
MKYSIARMLIITTIMATALAMHEAQSQQSTQIGEPETGKYSHPSHFSDGKCNATAS